VKTGPSFADAAVGRIAQGTKVLAEGGYEKIFQQTFETVPEEKLVKTFACYLSTSAGPVMGVLYLSTAKLAFCSDNPLSYKVGEQSQWSYYKVCALCFSLFWQHSLYIHAIGANHASPVFWQWIFYNPLHTGKTVFLILGHHHEFCISNDCKNYSIGLIYRFDLFARKNKKMP